ncbi:MAG: TonB-dependent receptor [Sphingobacteriia bacterium]|nr:MAG: TonB-dependent receptor [Sphingobacteriia bacterium]
MGRDYKYLMNDVWGLWLIFGYQNMYKKAGLWLLVQCLLGSLAAQNNDSIQALDPVVVTATRKATRWLALPYSTHHLNAQQISALQLRSSPEALMGQPGIFVQKTNHAGGSPFVRGLTGNQTLLIMDGIRLSNSTYRFGPNQYLNTIDVFGLAAIEVARGTGSVQYGSDAMGGVLQVFNHLPSFSEKPKFFGKVLARWVARGTEQSFRGEAGFSQQKFTFQAGITQRNFGDLPGGDSTGVQVPSGYKESAFDLKLKLKLSAQWQVTAFFQQMMQKDVPLYHRVKLENFQYYFFSPQQRSLAYVKSQWETFTPLAQKITLTVSQQANKEVRRYRRNGNNNAFEEKDQVNTLGATAEIFSVFSIHHSAHSGIEFYQDKVNSNRTQTQLTTGNQQNLRGLYPNGAKQGQFSVYSLHHVEWGSWRFEAGLRYHSSQIQIEDSASLGNASLGKIKVTPSALVTNLAIWRKLAPHHASYVSFSTGFRSPNIDDMGSLGLVDFRFEIPAYGLKPEKTYNWEWGYRWEKNKNRIGIALFYMNLQALITRVQVPGQQVNGVNVYTKENSQQSFVKGLEWEANWGWRKGWTLASNFTYAFGQNTSRDEPMRRIPPAFGRVLLAKQWRKWTFQLDQQFAGPQHRLAQGDKDDNRIPNGGTPGWYVAHLMLNHSLTWGCLQAGVINLFNADYRTHGSGINGQGRTISLTASVHW